MLATEIIKTNGHNEKLGENGANAQINPGTSTLSRSTTEVDLSEKYAEPPKDTQIISWMEASDEIPLEVLVEAFRQQADYEARIRGELPPLPPPEDQVGEHASGKAIAEDSGVAAGREGDGLLRISDQGVSPGLGGGGHSEDLQNGGAHTVVPEREAAESQEETNMPGGATTAHGDGD
eukprot:CAMPEP_0179449286 /NCGR_PEP_ID=MMETSP0799-20121207/33274_1 /TAXON_ID=46947 /ORGANISM="Geminigera cryophila, Strain CCMP2564" /LENGTH=177 /DNA_ID=CAMNT_0021242261 /DNA_START=346 /DNA_END=876 /DNA_ORIENTATION=-